MTEELRNVDEPDITWAVINKNLPRITEELGGHYFKVQLVSLNHHPCNSVFWFAVDYLR